MPTVERSPRKRRLMSAPAERWSARRIALDVLGRVETTDAYANVLLDNQRSLGTMAVLWQIEQAKRMGLPYVYLGFYIEESRKMSYKKRFHPLEIYTGGKWVVQQHPSP